MAQDDDKVECQALCYRCEHRARYLEAGRRPRCECGMTDTAKYSCYMYKPVRPVVLSKTDPADPRPPAGPWGYSARSRYVRQLRHEEGHYAMEHVDGGYVFIYKLGRPVFKDIPWWRKAVALPIRVVNRMTRKRKACPSYRSQ